MVTLYGPSGTTRRVRCLLDTAIHRTYLTTEVAEFLRLKEIGADQLNVSGYRGGYRSSNMKKYTLVSEDKTVRKQDSSWLDWPPRRYVNLCRGHLSRFYSSNRPIANGPRELIGDKWTGRVDLLIGADQYWELLTGDSLRLSPNLMHLNSIFGWYYGMTHQSSANDSVTMTLLIKANPIQLEEPSDFLAQLFDLDGGADVRCQTGGIGSSGENIQLHFHQSGQTIPGRTDLERRTPTSSNERERSYTISCDV